MRPLPRLFALTDGRVRKQPRFAALAEAIASAGPAVCLVARDPEASGAELTDLTAGLLARVRGTEAACFVASRPDLAAALSLPGLHLRASDLSVPDARRLVPHVWIGRSVHTATEGASAVTEGADYLVAGNIWETMTHPGRPGAGLGLIETLAGLGRPVIAIGGVTAARAREVRRAGGWGVAMISGLWSARRPGAAAIEVLTAMLA